MLAQLALHLLVLLPTLSTAFPALSPALPVPNEPQALAPTPVKPPKGTCTIHSIAVAEPDVSTDGSGCRPDTVGVAISADNSIMTFIFDDFQAAIGPKADNGVRKRALCKVNVTMSSPGWAFDVASVDFRGYVNLAKGVDASIVSRWKWVDPRTEGDLEGKGNIQKKLTGPYEEDFLLSKDGELSDNESSVCAKASARFQLTISASLSSTVTTASGLVQGGSLDTAFSEILGLTWRKC